MTWLDVVPPFLTAIASIAAAIAAIVSLRISKQALFVSESNALAVHHNSASLVYSKIVEELSEETREFSDFSYDLWVEWAKEFEAKDNYKLGGSNPRPIRHVLSNGSEILANYGLSNSPWRRSASHAILFVVRHGLHNLNDSEYQKLLKKADGEYQDFEGVFGIPRQSSKITSAPAFRWVCYQLARRVKTEDWRTAWKEAWLKNGWLYNYKTEYLKIQPILEKAQASLKSEKDKLAHTVYPLSYNTELSKKYNETLSVIEHLLRDCDSNLLEKYKDWDFDEELSHLVVCSMAIVYFANMQLNIIYKNAS